jgi:hypothetical protein
LNLTNGVQANICNCTWLDPYGTEQIISYSQTLDPERARTWTGRHRVLMVEAVVVEEQEPRLKRQEAVRGE